MARTTRLTQYEKIAIQEMYMVSEFELATLDIFQIANVLAPGALNMALTTRLTQYEKIARHEMYRFPVFELAKLDTFQMVAFFEITNRFRRLVLCS